MEQISSVYKLLPKHDKICCRLCFENDEKINYLNEWKIKNDPGAWGSEDPSILVLGFSKGATQTDIYQCGEFDDVAFGDPQKRTRRNLTDILRKVNLLSNSETADEKINACEKEFAFGSLIRCSLSRCDEKESGGHGKDVYKTSGQLITKSFKEIPNIIETCATQFLSALPERLKLIVMLGVSDAYIRNCKSVMSKIHPVGFHDINEIAYASDKYTWVHLTHPSKGNGTIKAWLTAGGSNPSGKKRGLALSVLKERCLTRA